MTDVEDTESQQKVWEIGVNKAGYPDDWEHHHPRAETEAAARKQALADSEFFAPCVYMVAGPFEEVL